MNSINYSISQTSILPSTQAKSISATHAPEHSTASSLSAVNSSSTIVNISSEAREKLAQEINAIGKDIAQKIHINESNKQVEESNKSDTERLDEIIADIQEQIKAVQQEIKALNGDKSEQAIAQRKALDAQLSSLNATLMGLMGKKLDAVES